MDGTIRYYEKHAEKMAARYETVSVDAVHAGLVEVFEGMKHLLEIGCGSGRDAAFLCTKGFEVTATDGSEAMLREAARLHPENADHLQFLRLPGNIPSRDGMLDGVYTIAVLMHFTQPDIASILKEIYRVLKPGGRLFFSVSLKRDDAERDEFDRNGRRFTELPEREWERLCVSGGFRKINSTADRDSLGRKGIIWGSYSYEK